MPTATIYSLDEIRQRITPVAAKHDIAAVYLFGSYARGEATDKSDVDLVIDAPQVNNLLVLSEIYADFEEALEKPLDLVTARALSQSSNLRFSNNVKKDMVALYR